MNNEEAKFILQGYRPNGADADDATFRTALDQAKSDPALGQWFARQQAFDAAVSAKLAEVRPPAELRTAILAGSRVSGAGGPGRAWWTRPAWLAAAAGIVLLLATGLTLWSGRPDSLVEFALDDARLSATHGGHGHENNELQAVLNDPTVRLGQKLPIHFANLLETGCRTVRFRGHDVLELCFKRNGVWFHCYIARATDFPGMVVASTPKLQDRDKVSLAAWSDAEHVIVVVSKTGRKNLEALL
jgi:hypothetical protein